MKSWKLDKADWLTEGRPLGERNSAMARRSQALAELAAGTIPLGRRLGRGRYLDIHGRPVAVKSAGWRWLGMPRGKGGGYGVVSLAQTVFIVAPDVPGAVPEKFLEIYQVDARKLVAYADQRYASALAAGQVGHLWLELDPRTGPAHAVHTQTGLLADLDAELVAQVGVEWADIAQPSNAEPTKKLSVATAPVEPAALTIARAKAALAAALGLEADRIDIVIRG
jgi:hypothetical protein